MDTKCSERVVLKRIGILYFVVGFTASYLSVRPLLHCTAKGFKFFFFLKHDFHEENSLFLH